MNRTTFTMCAEGCEVCTMAMVIAGQTPKTLNIWLTNNNGYINNNDLRFESLIAFGLKYQGVLTNYEEMKKFQREGYVLALHVDEAHHWVLCIGVEGDKFLVRDPFYDRTYYNQTEVAEAVYYHWEKGLENNFI